MYYDLFGCIQSSFVLLKNFVFYQLANFVSENLFFIFLIDFSKNITNDVAFLNFQSIVIDEKPFELFLSLFIN